MLRYRDLSNSEKKDITNGCGGKGGIINPPEFLFNASCNQHDFYYWRGGNWIDRLKADWGFYLEMLKDISLATKWYQILRKILYIFIATIYFFAVRLIGWKFFEYRDKMKTKKDL